MHSSAMAQQCGAQQPPKSFVMVLSCHSNSLWMSLFQYRIALLGDSPSTFLFGCKNSKRNKDAQKSLCAPDHIRKPFSARRVARGLRRCLFISAAFVVEDVAQLPLHEAPGLHHLGLVPRVKAVVVVQRGRAHAVQCGAHVSPWHVQRVRAAIPGPPAHAQCCWHTSLLKLLHLDV